MRTKRGVLVGTMLCVSIAMMQFGATGQGLAKSKGFQCPTQRGAKALAYRYSRANPLRVVADRTATFRQRHPNAGPAEVDAFMADALCVVRVDDGAVPSVVGTSTTNANLSWTNEGIYYDGRHHYADAQWGWAGSTYIFDWVYLCLGGCERNMGGPEGVAIGLNRKAIIPTSTGTGYSFFMTNWADGPHFDTSHALKSTAEKAGPQGVAFERQDVIYASCGPLTCDHGDYTMANGSILLYFDDYGAGCHDYQAFFKYGHTWDGSTITNYSFGTSGVTMTFSSGSSHHWSNQSPSGSARLC